MKKSKLIEFLTNQTRKFKPSSEGSESLGPLKRLPGVWKSEGQGWNIIALPFSSSKLNYRVLINQYNETLKFTKIDEKVPNRGLPNSQFNSDKELPPKERNDQFVTTLDYEQSIQQISSKDFPESNLAGHENKDIHHEPGLFLNMLNMKTGKVDIARLATIPHGNSVMALGISEELSGAPIIPIANSLPLRIPQDLDDPYLEPYKVFINAPFMGTLKSNNFPGFNPLDVNALLRLSNREVNINKTTVLPFDTSIKSGGIINIPFIERQADAVEMKSTFWLQELKELDKEGNPKLRLQYSQTVMLDFINVPGSKELIRWPHISINTLSKIPTSEHILA